jgi:hypothetical protein
MVTKQSVERFGVLASLQRESAVERKQQDVAGGIRALRLDLAGYNERRHR